MQMSKRLDLQNSNTMTKLDIKVQSSNFTLHITILSFLLWGIKTAVVVLT